MLPKIIQWAEKQKGIKALILLGSRVSEKNGDKWSDYDIAVFCDSDLAFIESEDWLRDIGEVWVCINEKISMQGRTFPTRLVIFQGGVKVDFSLLTTDFLDAMSKRLPDEFQVGYRVLLDKGNITHNLPKRPLALPEATKPTPQQFLEVIKEYWFEVYHVAVYLKREDLWLVKFRSGSTNEFLLRMIEWHSEAKHQWKMKTRPHGKGMQSWVDPKIWNALNGAFGHFDSHDSWEALLKSNELFRQVSIETAKMLGYDYPHDLDKNISGFILGLKPI